MKGQFLGIPLVWLGLLVLVVLTVIVLFLWFTGLLGNLVAWLKNVFFSWWTGGSKVGPFG